MTKQLQIYQCVACGNIVELLHAGAGEPCCCREPMRLFTENTVDASREKHLPVVEHQQGQECCISVKVGSVPHPMEEKHYIEWIEMITPDGKDYRQFLKPGDRPEALFKKIGEDVKVTVREYCNLHGLWQTQS